MFRPRTLCVTSVQGAIKHDLHSVLPLDPAKHIKHRYIHTTHPLDIGRWWRQLRIKNGVQINKHAGPVGSLHCPHPKHPIVDRSRRRGNFSIGMCILISLYHNANFRSYDYVCWGYRTRLGWELKRLIQLPQWPSLYNMRFDNIPGVCSHSGPFDYTLYLLETYQVSLLEQ